MIHTHKKKNTPKHSIGFWRVLYRQSDLIINLDNRENNKYRKRLYLSWLARESVCSLSFLVLNHLPLGTNAYELHCHFLPCLTHFSFLFVWQRGRRWGQWPDKWNSARRWFSKRKQHESSKEKSVSRREVSSYSRSVRVHFLSREYFICALNTQTFPSNTSEREGKYSKKHNVFFLAHENLYISYLFIYCEFLPMYFVSKPFPRAENKNTKKH